ncbi:hypothetical protein TREMEDRAFT_28847 [Tremella mesenterica DSM 1558]|uniref:uncharacterized protein n=1 Tax=Tremella mesenterica (strain ATCC 24925 / CBS 8224 / DSM 1558 / NBRC 9311 / NRRL Y-6157 / RJB 2259-6 / UBC 559-6) TaxID=578456 RepID=UPI0003F49CB8|nr:uncharacterized protein TREMEDRAFT_28847 [Tremella mesenterica DSM 1558]EIW70638.1 hypothetical protein TREMEDRAFT_28847 [Tremella mesenterica DSM 1558]
MTSDGRSKVDYVIFDMDGLLNILLAKYGYGQITWGMKAGQMGMPALPATKHLFSFFPGLEEKITPQEFIDERNAIQELKFRGAKPMPGALSLVQGLHEAGVPIAIATGSNLLNFQFKTSHLPELFSLFHADKIISADSAHVKRGKPFPDIYLAAARSLGRDVGDAEECTPEQAAERGRGLVFEDAVPGVKAGVAAGMNVVWVPDSNLRALAPDETYGAAQILGSLEEFKPSQWGLPYKTVRFFFF